MPDIEVGAANWSSRETLPYNNDISALNVYEVVDASLLQ